MDLEIRKFEESLVAHINHSKIPDEVKRLVLFEIFEKMTDVANEVVNKQHEKEIQARRLKSEGEEEKANAESPR